MAKSKIPGPLERSHLVEKEMDAESASKVAEAYLAEGRKNEAIEFLAKAFHAVLTLHPHPQQHSLLLYQFLLH